MDSPWLSTWQRWCPHDGQWADPLAALEAYLREPETVTLLHALEETEQYPRPVLDELRERGLGRLLADAGDPGSPDAVTTYQISSMSEMFARSSLSLAVTAGVTQFALLPLYIAADDDARRRAFAIVRGGGSAAILLTELAHGSDLLRNECRAEGGTLSASGEFVPARDPGAGVTHYSVTGTKDLINGGAEHDLLTTFVRTGKGRSFSDFSLLCIGRQAGVEAMERWQTLPIRSADISSVRFEGAVVPAEQLVGAEGDGFKIVQQALAFGRCGPAAAAVGLAESAFRMAAEYAGTRDLYGEPLVRLGAIGDHLIAMHARLVLIAALSIKQTATMNHLGFGGSYYSAVGKFLCPRLAEEIVDEGRRVLSARAMLRKYGFERIGRDVLLLGIFDGTQHVMLNTVQGRAPLLPGGSRTDPLAFARAVYASTPQPLMHISRKPVRLEPPPLSAQLRALAAVPGTLAVEPLVRLAVAFEATVAELVAAGTWAADQGVRLGAAEIRCGLEALVALAEVIDVERRRAIGIAPPRANADVVELDTLGARVAVGTLGARLAGDLRTLALRSRVEVHRDIEGVERDLLHGQVEACQGLRSALTAPRRAGEP